MASSSALPRASKEELLERYKARSAEFDAIALRRRSNPLLTNTEAPLAAPSGDDPRQAQLSERELEVVDLIANGFTNGEIGKRLFISEETVKSHLRNVLARLGAKNRAHAVALAFRGSKIS